MNIPIMHNIGKKMLALAFAMLSLSTASGAGDGFRDALMRMTIADSTDTEMRKAQMKMVVTGTVSSSLLGIDEEQERLMAESLDLYLEEQFVNDMVDASLPCYRDWMTIGQMDELTAMLMRPDVRQAKLHVHTTTMGVARNIGNTLQAIITPMLSGQTAELPPERPCPAAYKMKFDAYWASAGVERMVEAALDGLANSRIAGGDAEQASSLADVLMQSLKILMQNEFADNIPEQELDCLLSMMRTQAFAANVNALSCMSADMEGLYGKWIGCFVNWARKMGGF